MLLCWSIFTRDRLISLGLQQPPVVKDEVYMAVPMLTGDGFDDASQDVGLDCGDSRYRGKKRSLGLIFVEKVKLCCCIKDDMFSWESLETQPRNAASEARQSRI